MQMEFFRAKWKLNSRASGSHYKLSPAGLKPSYFPQKIVEVMVQKRHVLSTCIGSVVSMCIFDFFNKK